MRTPAGLISHGPVRRQDYRRRRRPLTHDAPVAAENRAIVRDVAVVPGTQAAWSVGVVDTGINWQFILR
jgi:hypothetical protein